MNRAAPSEHTIPKLRSTNVPRPRILTLLSEIPDFPITVVKAGAGYGKTTAVGNYVQQCELQVGWLTVRDADRFGARFAERVGQAVLPPALPESEWERVISAAHSPLTWLLSAQWMGELVSTFVHDERIFVLDDFHLVDEDAPILQWVDEWLRCLPPNVHVVFVTRTQPALSYLESLADRGDVLWVRERDLAFTELEVGFLYHAGLPGGKQSTLEEGQVRWLVQRTGGMAMVLSMLLRDWRQHGKFARLQQALEEHASIQEQVGRLFLLGLPPRDRDILQETCVFTTLHPALCDEVRGLNDSSYLLGDLERRGYLTVTEDGQAYELHPLVRHYLAKSLTDEARERLAERAISWHLQRGEESRAILYLFSLRDESRMVEALFRYIPAYLARGEVSTVQGWLDRLPARTINRNAALLITRAEINRHINSFSEALTNYQDAYGLAERRGDRQMLAQVEMGRARLYLDTIQPAQIHLWRARSWVAREERSMRINILQLAFENSINQGRIQRAKRLQRALTTLPGATLPNNNSDVRLLLRCGEIQSVISALKPRISVDPVGGRNALSHREATLLLSLMYAMQGDSDKARAQALRGHGVGQSLSAPFVSAVGLIRLGHAEHLANPLSDAALSAYQEAMGSMDEMEVPRGKSEALLGLCLAHGYRRQLALARTYAQQGIDLAERAGDIWMANLVRAAHGQVQVVNEQYDAAVRDLTDAVVTFRRCGDPFLETACYLWRAIARFYAEDGDWQDDLSLVLKSVEAHDWPFLLQKPTLCGVRDVQMLVPLLQQHRSKSTTRGLAVHHLHALSSADIEHHPGYTLRVQTLGNFLVRRGFIEISRRDWQREKARQLFQFLLTHRDTLLHREEICERLWGELNPDAAERDFKVAMTVLSSVIEPHKPGRGLSSFIVRQGSLYGLCKHPMLSVDRDEFLQTLRDAETEQRPSTQKCLACARNRIISGGLSIRDQIRGVVRGRARQTAAAVHSGRACTGRNVLRSTALP